jgi:hypothetical protein
MSVAHGYLAESSTFSRLTYLVFGFLRLIMTNANKDMFMCLYVSLSMFIFSDKVN